MSHVDLALYSIQVVAVLTKVENKKLEDDFVYSLMSLVEGFELKSHTFCYNLTHFWRYHCLKLKMENTLCQAWPLSQV